MGGLLTLYLQSGDRPAADQDSTPSDTPSATYDYVRCPSPAESEESTLQACAYPRED
ncbi:hypothetical protein [Streptomyces sp. RK9]|uniref:hypothetical protein n=1 Tax=Streptomyces sp. RK9 TaxID=3239284 RepID=UPI00386F355D